MALICAKPHLYGSGSFFIDATFGVKWALADAGAVAAAASTAAVDALGAAEGSPHPDSTAHPATRSPAMRSGTQRRITQPCCSSGPRATMRPLRGTPGTPQPSP